jgi:hypothetical protein
MNSQVGSRNGEASIEKQWFSFNHSRQRYTTSKRGRLSKLVFEDHIEKKKLEANQENSRVVKNQKNSH